MNKWIRNSIVGATLLGAAGIALAVDHHFTKWELSYELFREYVHSKSLEETIADVATADGIWTYDVVALAKSISPESNGVIIKDDRLEPLDTIPSDLETNVDFWQNTIIVPSDSPFMDQFYREVSKKNSDFVRENVDYIVFSPDIINRLPSEGGNVAGISTRQGVVIIDTISEDGGLLNPKEYISIIGHEADHESKTGYGYKLIKEKRAKEREIKFLKDQIEYRGRDHHLEALLEKREERIATADFLLKPEFGNDFMDVYPFKTLLAKDLLDTNISKKTLRKYSGEKDTETERERHLRISSEIALHALEKSHGKAIRYLYGIVIDPKSKNTYRQISAASALQFLAPNAMFITYSADLRVGEGEHLNYGPRKKTNEVGKVVHIVGYRVTGIPGLPDLLKNTAPKNNKP